MAPIIYVNGEARPLMLDLRFSMFDYFQPEFALFDMSTSPATEIELCNEHPERGVTRRKLLPNGNYSAFARPRGVAGGFFSSFTPVCIYVMNLPPSATEVMLRNFFAHYGTVNEAGVFQSSDGQSNGRGWVSFFHPSCLSKIPRSLEFLPEFPRHFIYVEMSDTLPDGPLRAANAFANPDTLNIGSLPSSSSEVFPTSLTSADHRLGTSSMPPVSQPAMKAITSNESPNKVVSSPMKDGNSFSVPERTTQCFIVHSTDEEAHAAVKEQCVVPKFSTDAIFASSAEDVLLLFTVRNKSVLFGVARLLTRKRAVPERLILHWISAYKFLAFHELDKEGTALATGNGSSIPPLLAERLCTTLKCNAEKYFPAPVNEPPHFGSGGSTRSPVELQRYPPRRGRGGFYHHRGFRGRGREPRPIGDEGSQSSNLQRQRTNF